MRDCWDVLGLEYGVDKKAIKSAYAKRLKKTRPDEDPEGFKALHDAYKTAVQIASSDYYQQEAAEQAEQVVPLWDEDSLSFDDDDLLSDVPSESTPHSKKPEAAATAQLERDPEEAETHQLLANDLPDLSTENARETTQRSAIAAEDNEQQLLAQEAALQASAEEEAMYASLQADWDGLFERVQALIASSRGGLKVKEWQFIEDVPSMLDLEFKSRASDQMFGIVAETNEISLRSKSLRIQPPVLSYLNDYFGWDDKWQDYEMRFSPSMLDSVYPYLSSAQNADAEHSNGTREVHYYKRLMAFLMDAGIVMGVVKFALLILAPLNLAEAYDDGLYFQALAFYFLLVVPLLEASRTEASLGKMVFGLKVISKQGLKLPWYQSFWRSIVTLLCIAGFKIVVWVNIFFIHKYDALLQDVATRSYVARSESNLFSYLNVVKGWFSSRKG